MAAEPTADSGRGTNALNITCRFYFVEWLPRDGKPIDRFTPGYFETLLLNSSTTPSLPTRCPAPTMTRHYSSFANCSICGTHENSGGENFFMIAGLPLRFIH